MFGKEAEGGVGDSGGWSGQRRATYVVLLNMPSTIYVLFLHPLTKSRLNPYPTINTQTVPNFQRYVEPPK
jgi:hypothetical protein